MMYVVLTMTFLDVNDAPLCKRFNAPVTKCMDDSKTYLKTQKGVSLFHDV